MSSAESYEQLPYPSAAFSQTHPWRLGAVATLHGVDAPPPDSCRVLELGCSDGGNLINIAYTLPGADCVGIDYAPGHIAAAKRTAAALGLTNCSFFAADIAALPDVLGAFDYIIAHGVYSWIPAHIQDSLLRACGELLTPTGIAYVSYNTFPGWHGYRMMREVLALGVEPAGDVRQRIIGARDFLAELQRTSGGDNPAYTSIVASTADNFRRSEDAYLGHEYFEDDNEPSYFQEFIGKARIFGLEYVAEAFSPGTYLHNAPQRVLDEIAGRTDDRVESEQWLDFFIGRQFRKTLLCKAQRNMPTELDSRKFRHLHIAPMISRVEESPDDAPQFVAPNGLAIGSGNPVLRRALELLAERRPHSVSFDELLAAAAGNAPSERDAAAIIALCRQCYDDMLAHFFNAPSNALRDAGSRPRVSAVARLQAQSGMIITTLNHTAVQFDEPIPILLLRVADGSRTRDELLEILRAEHDRGGFTLSDADGRPLTNRRESEKMLSVALDVCLEQFARFALLEAEG